MNKFGNKAPIGRTSFNCGVRFTPAEVKKLDQQQAFARANEFRLSDSKLMRAGASFAEADIELAQTIKGLRPSAGKCTCETSINWRKDGFEAVSRLAKDVGRIAPELGCVSVNEIARALVDRMREDITFLGILRAYVDSEKERKPATRHGRKN